ncbi:neuroligin-3-like [Palaemon carinicauda]|uniref:neuroligin-3-like n=1 Tax=Palaemon carinicauda TaxID=392227 RepID=UPI0035B6268F
MIMEDDGCLEGDKSSLRMTTAIFFFFPNNSGAPSQGRTMHEVDDNNMIPPPTICRYSPLTRSLYHFVSIEPHLLDPSTPPNSPPCLLADAALMAYPVVVFIHGESFEWGSSSLYDGSVLAALGKVIVVTLNYRLGILGFYNANADPVGRATVANYGLMDQLAALHWVQENIVRFGGDPGQVTVMGHGTGAACLNYLVISPAATAGLFKRAILMSGSALSPWASVRDPSGHAFDVATQLDCPVPNDLFRN